MSRLAGRQDRRHAILTPGGSLAVRLALLATVSVWGWTIAGCVSEAEYRQALSDAEAAKAQAQEAQTESTALETQLKALETEMGTLTSRSQALSTELEALRKTQMEEQLAFDEAIGRMHQAMIALKSQNRTLQHDYDEQQKENIALAALVQRYSRELEELQAANTRPAAVPAAMPAVAPVRPATPPAPPAVVIPPSPAPKPTPAPPAAAPDSAPAGDDGWLGTIMRWLLAIWHLIF